MTRLRSFWNFRYSGVFWTMTTAEKEKRIMDLGGPWLESMKRLQQHRKLSTEEETSPYANGLMLAKEHGYSVMLSEILTLSETSR